MIHWECYVSLLCCGADRASWTGSIQPCYLLTVSLTSSSSDNATRSLSERNSVCLSYVHMQSSKWHQKSKSLGVWTTNGNTCTIFYGWYKALNTVSLLLSLSRSPVCCSNPVQYGPTSASTYDGWPPPLTHFIPLQYAARSSYLSITPLLFFSYPSLSRSPFSHFQQSHSHCPSASVCVWFWWVTQVNLDGYGILGQCELWPQLWKVVLWPGIKNGCCD